MKYFTHETTRLLARVEKDLRSLYADRELRDIGQGLPRWARMELDGTDHVLTLVRGKVQIVLTTDRWRGPRVYVVPPQHRPVDVTEHAGPWVQYASTEVHLMRHELDERTRAEQAREEAQTMEDLKRAWSCFE